MLVVITGPSGSGKTTLAENLLGEDGFKYHKSVTTREKRSEDDDIYYEFVNEQTFKNMILKNKFIEHEEVYPGKYYGTTFIPLSDIKPNGPYLIMVKDVVGAKKLKSVYGAGCFTVMLKADDTDVIIERLEFRDGEKLEKDRIKKTDFENQFDDSFADLVLKVDENLPHNIKTQVLEKLMEE